MRINHITENENRNISVPKAGLLGAAVGYLGTYAVPLTTEEHAKYFTPSVKNGIIEKSKNARRSEIEVIKNELKENNISPLVKDIFEKSANALENNPKSVIKDMHQQKNFDKNVKDVLGNLYKRVYNTGKVTKMTEEASVALAAKKDNRAGLYYAGIGALVLMTFAVVKNSIETFLPKKSDKKEETNEINPTAADYLIDLPETVGEIYLFEKTLEKNND